MKVRLYVNTRPRLLHLVLAALWLTACSPPQVQESPLVVEEYALVELPHTESGAFQLVEGSMQHVRLAHEAQRSRLLTRETIYINGQPALRARLGSQTLTARYQRGELVDSVILQSDGREIHRVEIGTPSPIEALRGLWTYDGHWVLETAYVTHDSFGGRITRDGTTLQYDEAFDFQLLGGRPFFFFSRQGRIGISYANEELDVHYDEVPHYGCCSAAALNPLHAEDMLAFFARRGSTWYYVEAGLFGGFQP